MFIRMILLGLGSSPPNVETLSRPPNLPSSPPPAIDNLSALRKLSIEDFDNVNDSERSDSSVQVS